MITLNEEFQPLFTSDERYFVITGGRGSQKSFSTATFSTLLTYEKGHRQLYTRYTMKSAEISIIPEFKEKLELFNAEGSFKIGGDNITNKLTGSDILFRGLKTSSGFQTANLKSIQGVTTWVLDEAEELIDEKIFDKIDLSIRQKGVRNRVIIIMNPATRLHWVWQRWFEKTKKYIEIEGFKVPISTHPDVCHIHMTYLDNIENLDPGYLKVIEDMKKNDRQRYLHEIIGGWKQQLDGTLFQVSDLKRYKKKDLRKEEASTILGYIDVADEGTDFFSFPIAHVFPKKIFITDVLFTKDNVDITLPRSVGLIKAQERYKVEGKNTLLEQELQYVRVESNNQGSVFIKMLRNLIGVEKILKVTHTANKHTRILLMYGFIKEYCYFPDDSEIIPGSEMDLFMRGLFDYMKDDSGKKNEHDDAPDSLAGLAKFIQSFLPELFK